MTNLQKILERFDKRFCYKDRGLKTRMNAHNSLSMSNGIKLFISEEFSSLLQVIEEKDKKIVELEGAVFLKLIKEQFCETA